jgi:riboflavin biosynthesis pyrimidine reductase
VDRQHRQPAPRSPPARAARRRLGGQHHRRPRQPGAHGATRRRPQPTPRCARAHGARARDAGVDVIELDPLADGSLPIPELLAALAARGLHSLFVEGGGYTLSRFLAADSLDLLHLHIAPLILGSGVPTFALPVVERLAQARRFHSQHFDVDGELLVACEPMTARFA